jgi:hypothetical protein
MQYSEFIEAKKHSIGNFGFVANWIPDIAFDFQRHIITKAMQKGRIGIFNTYSPSGSFSIFSRSRKNRH